MTNEDKLFELFEVVPDIYCRGSISSCERCLKRGKVICNYWLRKEYAPKNLNLSKRVCSEYESFMKDIGDINDFK